MYRLLWFIAVINFMGIISVIFSMATRVTPNSLSQLMSSSETLSAFTITCTSVGVSVVIICIVGIPIAYILANNSGNAYRILEAVTCIPLVLPPSVAGLGMLMTFGTRGVIGSWLAHIGIKLPFTFMATVCVQIFIATPFFIQVVKGKFENIGQEVIEAAKVFGADHKELLFQIYLPLSKKKYLCRYHLMCFKRGR